MRVFLKNKKIILSSHQNNMQMKKNIALSIFAALAVLMLLNGCANNPAGNAFVAKPNAIGKINSLKVVADDALWESPVKDTFEFYFESAYPLLPQPEPLFDVAHFTPKTFEDYPVKREYANMIFLANLSDKSSPTTRLVLKDFGKEKIDALKSSGKKYTVTIGRDKWAKGQVLVYLVGFSKEDLIDNIKKNYAGAVKRIQKENEDRVEAEVFAGGVSGEMTKLVEDQLGVRMRIPPKYFKAVAKDNFVWLRKETRRLSLNIMLYKMKYTDKSIFSKDRIIAIRDSLGRKYVSTPRPDTYMRVNNVDLPVFSNITEINGNYTVRVVGIWDIVNDFMGGPFVTYMIHSTKTNEVLFADVFLHAPTEEKRDHMIRLEQVLKTIEF